MATDKLYILMNKPCGYVCSAVSDSHKTVYSLLPDSLHQLLSAKRGSRLHTVGRLDCETSGLLLLTNDGDFSHKLTAPENHILKTYVVTLKNPVPAADVKMSSGTYPQNQKEYAEYFSKPHFLPAEKKAPEQTAAPAKLEFISDFQCKVTIQEGKFHQVRRMFSGVGNEVIALHRISVGNFKLPEDLPSGNYVFISPDTGIPR